MHKVFELYKLFHGYLCLFPQHEKYSLGQKIEGLILDTIEIIIKATRSPVQKKIDLLRNVDAKISVLKILIRLANEIKSIDNKKYFILEEKLQEIGRMLGGWIKSVKDQ